MTDSESHTVLLIRAVPNASRNAVVGLTGDAVKVKIQAPPEDGKANKALIKFLAGLLNVPKSAITLESGHTSRNKRINIQGIQEKEVRQKLGV